MYSATVDKAVTGDVPIAINTAGTVAIVGPIPGIISNNPAIIESGKAKLTFNAVKPTYDMRPMMNIRAN